MKLFFLIFVHKLYFKMVTLYQTSNNLAENESNLMVPSWTGKTGEHFGKVGEFC